MNKDHDLWVERYRPTNMHEYIFHDPLQATAVASMIKERTIPHLLFSGVQGCGKTTLALVIINELGVLPEDVLTINASDENNVDVMRGKITDFVATFAMGDIKIVHLEEADYITPNGQAVMRRLMEQYADSARFILTCNYSNKIISAVKSRCQEFHFSKPNVTDITVHVAEILVKEEVIFDIATLDKYVYAGYPDIRKIINLLQQHSHGGSLEDVDTENDSGDYKLEMLDLLGEGDWNGIRKLTCAQVATEEWEGVYRFLYDNLTSVPGFQGPKWENGIVIIADHLYKHSLVADPEINAAAMFIRLGQI